MAEQWVSYFCTVNDKVASIFLDLSLRESCPDFEKLWLLWAFVPLMNPRVDGLSSREEFETLVAMEDKLVMAVSHALKATWAGRITTDGRREFYFYGAAPEGFANIVSGCLGAFGGYSAECGEKHDPEWREYLDVLFPSDNDLERIKNRDVLDSLEAHGDNPDIPRDVEHFAYFPTEASREDFVKFVSEKGYRTVSTSQCQDGARRYGICIAKTQTTQPESVDDTVLELCEIVRSYVWRVRRMGLHRRNWRGNRRRDRWR